MPVSIGLRAVSSAVLANAVAAAGAYGPNELECGDDYILPYYQHHHQNPLYHYSTTPISSFSQYAPITERPREESSLLNFSGSDEGSGCEVTTPVSTVNSTSAERKKSDSTFHNRANSPGSLQQHSEEETGLKKNSSTGDLNAISTGTGDSIGNMMEQPSTIQSMTGPSPDFTQHSTMFNEVHRNAESIYHRSQTHSNSFNTSLTRSAFGNVNPSVPEGIYTNDGAPSVSLHKPAFGMHPNVSGDGPSLSYATLTPLQPLTQIPNPADKYGSVPSNAFVSQDMSGLGDLSGNYQKMTGMGQSLPPLSNHMLLNGLNVQHSLQPPVVGSAADTENAAMGIPQYARSPTNFHHPPNPYETHMLDTLEAFPSAPLPTSVFSARPNGFGHNFHSSRSSGMSHSRENKAPVGAERVTPVNLNGGNNQHQQPSEEVNTKDVAAKITQELKRYSIPQAIFAQRVLCRSQGTLSDLLRNPKPWSKLKSGRETFRRMWKWLQEPEFQRMSALRLAGREACKRKEDEKEYEKTANGQKKPRLVFTDLQRRTLHAIFKQNKRPSKETQVQIAQQLGLEVTTVSNFFMNARRRSIDKWQDEESASARNNAYLKQAQQALSQQHMSDLRHPVVHRPHPQQTHAALMNQAGLSGISSLQTQSMARR
uniref:hepatocyte nuclear factor 6-like isoform X1 n=1 Tax=Styela clava TaxID=7725 RepID=UPI00193A976D|nr:hepatocyte nuclear factor 6-like isoform X1 [Styela clava]